MKKTLTKSSRFQLLSRGIPLTILALVAIVFNPFKASAQAPYCNASYTSTLNCNTYNWYVGEVDISTGGTSIFNKANDMCNNAGTPHYSLMSTTSSFSLSTGGTYTISISSGTNGFAGDRGVWIDMNRDNDFTDAGDFFVNIPYTGSGSVTFTLPCTANAGVTRMRIRSQYWNNGPWAKGQSCASVNYGETEDYTMTLASSSGLSSDFFVADTSFVGTPVTFVNSNQTGYISHEWTINGNSYSTTDVTEVFGTVGLYTAKLVSTNCLGKDSTTKTFRIIAPTAPPVANFVSTKNVVEIFELFDMVDLSTNGATFWDWSFISADGTDTVDGDDQFQLRGNNPFLNKNPFVNTGNYIGALDVGTWQVCLKASNVVGSSPTFCKTAYITVQRTSFNMGPATSLPSNIITSASGTIFDKGGENNDYTVPESNLEALIAPCGAQSVTLEFNMFKLNANATLQIYDGVNALGTPLHTGAGFTAGNVPTSLTANSGALYMLWNSSTGAVDSGFAATWTSVSGTGAAPIASFDLPSTTLYNSVFLDILNTSQNAEGNTEFLWTLSGPAPGSSTTRDLEDIVFTTNGTYTLCLKVTGCDGVSSTSCQTFDVVAPTTPTELDFTADNQRPAVGDDVIFTATSDKANRWEWNFFPPLGVTANAPASDNLNERSFKFIAPGSYTVQLRGFNTVDTAASEATVVKTAYIIVVQHCVPVVGVSTSTDVGISKVSLEDPSTSDVYENSSATGVAYTDFSSLGTIDLNFGGTYNFDIERSSNVNPMSRKIWIDWNVDGDFDDAGETVATQATGTSMNWTGTFTVPANAFEANTVLRVGVSYDNDLNLPCGANSNPNANRVGEFEDYAIRVVNDGDVPLIALIDADTVYIEQKDLADIDYVTAGATALDPSQGDITANITMTTDVDQTLPGIYYEVYNVMDASGNAAPTVTRVVYVTSDRTAPVITVTGAIDTTIEVGTVWTDLPASAMDNKEGDISDAIVTSGAVDFNLLGDYIITYSVQDNQGNASAKTRTVHVVDTELPVIENASADKSGACWVVEVQLQNIFADITTATDNYNTLADNLTFTANPASPQGGAAVDTRFQGTTSVTYTATDESGNTTTQCVDYVVKDYIAPVINLRTLDVINHRVNTPYVPVAAEATDNLYSSSEISLTATSDVDAFILGTYYDTYTATDAAGNVATKTRTVNVIDDIKPVISGKNGGVVKLGVGSSIRGVDYINFSDDYDTPEDLLANHVLIYNDLNQSEAGLYSVVFRTQDNSGNISDDYTLIFDVSHKYEKRTNSVEDLSIEDMLTVSPNPTKGAININVNLSENEEINLAVYNTMGQQVVLVENGTITNNSYTVNLDNQANGIYYVKMNLKGNIITKKIVLNK